MRATVQPTEIDLAKMAAIIDCETHIQISLNRPRYHHLQITMANVDSRLVKWCSDRFGGAVYPQWYKKRPPKRADATRWRLNSDEAADLLKRCFAELIIKQEEARIAIDFQKTFPHTAHRVTPEMFQLRESYHLKLKALTKRGPKPNSPQTANENTPSPSPRQRSLFAA